MKKAGFLLIALMLGLSQYITAQKETRLLRFPSYFGNNIVFTYAGDLYTVAKPGGLARKLTSDVGYELFAKYSPDGKWIAFTGQYDGNTEVYVIPAGGGVPKRLTVTATLNRDDVSDRMGPNNIVMAWTPDSREIIYRSRKQTFNDFKGQLFKVSIDGGISTELPLPAGGFCAYSPDGKKLAYNRIFREFRTWKYYKGGMADDVWIYDFNTKETVNISNNDGQDIFPMWSGENVYYLSNRDRIMNLFVYNTVTKQTRKLTNYTDYDIKFPSLGDNGIIYENAGYLYIFDLATEKAEKISVTISDDFDNGRNSLKDASKNINTANISPDGKRLVISARGDVFSVPAKSGITRNLTQSSGAHDRNAIWSPDGKNIAWLSDKSGEYEIWMQKQDGSEAPVQLTSGADTYKFDIQWSPDSKKILWNDKKLRLQFVDVNTKKVTLVAQSKIWEFTTFNWSPDSKWITYASQQKNGMNIIMLYNVESGVNTELTEDWFDSNRPDFSSDGKYIVFTSRRDFNPVYSETEWNHAYRDMSRIYLMTLNKNTASPFAPENDEVKIEKAEDAAVDEKAKDGKAKDGKWKDAKTEPEKEKKKVDVVIDLDGIKNRVIALPVNPGNYWSVTAVNGGIYYNETSAGDESNSLKYYDLKKKKETELGQGMGFDITTDGKKMLVSKQGKYYVIDLPTAKINLEESVDLSNLKVWVNNAAEWKQIYDESWRQMCMASTGPQ
jgi:tricorn protease